MRRLTHQLALVACLLIAAGAAAEAQTTPAPAPPAPGGAAPPDPAAANPQVKPGWEPTAGAQLELGGRKKVFVGDRFTLVITVIARPEVTVNLPGTLDLGAFTVSNPKAAKPERLDSKKLMWVFRLRIAAFEVGELKLPPVPVTYTPPASAFTDLPPGTAPPALTVSTKIIRQVVSSVLANEPQPTLRANEKPVEIFVEDKRAKIGVIILAAVAVGVLLGLLLFFLIRRRRRKPKPAPPPRPAHEIALEKLAWVRQQAYLERGEFKIYYFGVSEAIRDYLGNRYGFDSLELTTTELMEEMSQVELIGIRSDELQRFLLDCDLVKFARYIPPVEDAQAAFGQAEHIVHATKYIPPDEEDDEDEDGEDGEDQSIASAPTPSEPPAENPDARWMPEGEVDDGAKPPAQAPLEAPADNPTEGHDG